MKEGECSIAGDDEQNEIVKIKSCYSTALRSLSICHSVP